MKFLNIFKKQRPTLAVMFADVAGSTQLYEKMGDAIAQKEIATCIAMMSSFVQKNHGEVIKTIGDEIMSRFPTADQAALAAKNIQDFLENKSQNGKLMPQVRIGIHYGEVILKKGDLFGDVINVAARIATIAKARQILISKESNDAISPNIGIRTRKFDSVKVKGKADELIIYDILWEEKETELTVLASASVLLSAPSEQLVLIYENSEQDIFPDTRGFSLGRGSQCDFAINSNLASRIHAIVEYQRGKFVLKDQSSNGTYVQDQDGKEHYLRREEISLIGEGVISLGAPAAENKQHVICYRCY